MAIQIACSWCGSTNVSRDAWATWDEAGQAWVLGTVFDDGFCHRCERERGLEEHAMTATVPESGQPLTPGSA